MTVLDELANEMAQMPLAEDHKVIEAFCPGGPDKPFGVWVAVRLAGIGLGCPIPSDAGAPARRLSLASGKANGSRSRSFAGEHADRHG